MIHDSMPPWSSPLTKVEILPPAPEYIPAEPTTVSCADSETGRWSKPKIFGYLLTPEILEMWARKQGIPTEGRSFFNTQYQALCGIFESLPEDFGWAVVIPHNGCGVVWCISVGNDLSEQDLLNAKDSARLEIVQKALDMDLGSPGWYYLEEEFHSDW